LIGKHAIKDEKGASGENVSSDQLIPTGGIKAVKANPSIHIDELVNSN